MPTDDGGLPPSVFADVAKAMEVTPRKPYRQCRNADDTQKQQYPREGAAWSGIRALQARPGYVGDPERPLMAYRCPRCKHWHIGKLPEPKKRKR